ncbi:MAG: type I restriction-modification system subunit M N-terminal domain-containing protein [Kiritimatiellia bacterium]
MKEINKKIDMLWDDEPIDVSAEANFIWSIANKLRGTYMPDKYGDVIIPMTILRRFECALTPTKNAVIEAYEKNPALPSLALEKKSGFQFYNTSHYDLKELQNESDKLAENFINYIDGFSSNVQDIMKQLKLADHIKTMDEGSCLLTVVKAFSELDLKIVYP